MYIKKMDIVTKVKKFSTAKDARNILIGLRYLSIWRTTAPQVVSCLVNLLKPSGHVMHKKFNLLKPTDHVMHQQFNLLKSTGHVMRQQFNLLKPTGHVMHQQFNLLKPTGHAMHQQFNINNCTFCSHCIYVFCNYLRTNSDLCHLHHKLIDFYNRDEKCLLRLTNWVFK